MDVKWLVGWGSPTPKENALILPDVQMDAENFGGILEMVNLGGGIRECGLHKKSFQFFLDTPRGW